MVSLVTGVLVTVIKIAVMYGSISVVTVVRIVVSTSRNWDEETMRVRHAVGRVSVRELAAVKAPLRGEVVVLNGVTTTVTREVRLLAGVNGIIEVVLVPVFNDEKHILAAI